MSFRHQGDYNQRMGLHLNSSILAVTIHHLQHDSHPNANEIRLNNYRKHRRLSGWGLICPSMTQAAAQELLDKSVEVGKSRHNAWDEYCFQSNSDNTENNGEPVWHGFPIKWSDLPTEAKNKLIANGTLTNTFYRKALRKSLGLEPDS